MPQPPPTLDTPPGVALSQPALPVRRRTRRVDPAIVGALLVAALLRMVALGDQPLAPAEATFWTAAAGPLSAIAEVGAPLGPLFAWLAVAAAGLSELTVRWPSAAAGVLLVALVVPLGRRIGGPALARWAAWIAAGSPFLVFYARTATPIALATLLALLSTWWYLFLTTGRRRALAGFFLATLLLGWTSPGALAILAAQGAFLWMRRASRRTWALWLLGAGLAFTASLPRIGPLALAPDQSSDVVAEIAALVYKLIAPAAAFALGETLPVWQPLGIAALLLVAWLALLGLIRLPRPGRQFLLVFGLLPLLWTATVTAIGAPRSEAGSVGASAAYGWPAFGLMVAAGVVALASPLRKAVFATLVAASTVAYGGYFHVRDVAQPAYLLPVREVLSFVEARAEPGDLLVADPGSMVAHHAAIHPARLPVLAAADPAGVEATIETDRPPRIWFVSSGDLGSPLVRWITLRYQRIETRTYLDPDPAAIALKERLLGGVGAEAPIVLTLYQRR
ncbi:MAG: glycosyltransferase family 39 protein [Dehalococcoidia bacterium]